MLILVAFPVLNGKREGKKQKKRGLEKIRRQSEKIKMR